MDFKKLIARNNLFFYFENLIDNENTFLETLEEFFPSCFQSIRDKINNCTNEEATFFENTYEYNIFDEGQLCIIN